MAVLWHKLPERIPIHWGWNGQVDGWSPRWFGLLFLPVVNIVAYLLMTFLPFIDPRMRSDNRVSTGNLMALSTVRLVLTAFVAFLFAMQMLAALDPMVDSGILVINGVLVTFLIMGNFLGNLKPNRFVGIRTPWTLKNDETWRATHRNAGPLIVYGSLALLILQFFVRNITPVVLGGVILLALWAVGYSWWYFHQWASRPKP